jgi:hypothetical protein
MSLPAWLAGTWATVNGHQGGEVSRNVHDKRPPGDEPPVARLTTRPPSNKKWSRGTSYADEGRRTMQLRL